MSDLGVALGPFWLPALIVVGLGVLIVLFGARPGRPRLSNWIGWALMSLGGLLLVASYIWFTTPVDQ